MDPRRVDLPAIEGSSETELVTYFLETGTDVKEYVGVLQTLPEEPLPDDCSSIAQALDRIGGPRHVADIALESPDSSTADMILQSIAATVDYLAMCVDGRQADQGELRFALVVLERRIVEVTG